MVLEKRYPNDSYIMQQLNIKSIKVMNILNKETLVFFCAPKWRSFVPFFQQLHNSMDLIQP